MDERRVREVMRELKPRHVGHLAEKNAEFVENGENAPDLVDFSMDGGINKGLRTAERQLIGCLLVDCELFHLSLPDGRMLDEALLPEDIKDYRLGRLYAVVYERLAQGHALSIASLLGELAARGLLELSDLATEIEAEIEEIAQGNSDVLRQMVPELVYKIQSTQSHPGDLMLEDNFVSPFREDVSETVIDRQGAMLDRLKQLRDSRSDNPLRIKGR